MIWKTKPLDRERAGSLAGALNISPALARLLVGRGLADPETARRFLDPRSDHLLDPYLMADMPQAVERFRRAARDKEKVFVFGDYDVDGVTSIAALAAFFDSAGIPFEAHQPNRLKEGYGLSEAGVDLALKSGCSLLVALDCGTEAGRAVEKAGASGLDVVVLDHHKQHGDLPPALAVLNPNRDGCPYPFKDLAAVGVVFKFLQAGHGHWGVSLPWERIWQLAALGTVADVAPLTGENRVLVGTGLKLLRQNRDPAFRALIGVSGIDPREIKAHHLAFQLAPRLNAAGRMGTPETGRRLLRSKELSEIEKDAARLDKMNRDRRAVQAAIFDEVEEKIRSRPELYQGKVIVVEGDGWNKGVIGIVASKVQEKYYRPTVIIALEGEEGVGSARSIPGFDLFEAISRCGSVLEKFGGHKYAAGMNLKREKVGEFRELLDRTAGEMLSEGDLVPKLAVDAELGLGETSLELARELEKLEPFGLGNPRPSFLSRTLSLKGPPRVMGKKENHLKARLGADGAVRECVGWDMAERAGELGPGPIDIVYQIKTDNWRGEERIQMILKDFRAAEAVDKVIS